MAQRLAKGPKTDNDPHELTHIRKARRGATGVSRPMSVVVVQGEIDMANERVKAMTSAGTRIATEVRDLGEKAMTQWQDVAELGASIGKIPQDVDDLASYLNAQGQMVKRLGQELEELRSNEVPDENKVAELESKRTRVLELMTGALDTMNVKKHELESKSSALPVIQAIAQNPPPEPPADPYAPVDPNAPPAEPSTPLRPPRKPGDRVLPPR